MLFTIWLVRYKETYMTTSLLSIPVAVTRSHFVRTQMQNLVTAVCLLLLSFQCNAQATGGISKNIPKELSRVISSRETLLAFERADLNGDGLEDIVFIVETQVDKAKGQDDDDENRVLKIALRLPDNSLKVVKSNDKVVLCAKCGGVFGDPFSGLAASKSTFSVHHYGGSGWRWSNTYKFAYSRKDATWQLVEVNESSFHASEPDKQKNKTYRPPKNFGKIDISEFDPEKFMKIGRK